MDPSDRKWSGGLYDEGRRMWFISPNRDHAASAEEKKASIDAFRKRAGDVFKQGEWNKYRIVCIGSHIQIYINDVLTTDVHDEMDIAGHIGLQHHGWSKEAHLFRNLRIRDLGAGGEVYYPHRENAKQGAVASKIKGDVYEAEDAKLVGCKKSTEHTGYQGTGYVDFGGAGSYVEWDNVLGETNGVVSLTLRYAAMDDRPCELFVNDQNVGRVAFAGTGSWESWKTVDMDVTLKQGGNFIKIVAVNQGPNLDAIAVNKKK